MAHPSQADASDISNFVSSTTVTLSDVALAIVVLIASWIVARLARRAARTMLGRLDGISEDVRQLTARVTFYFVLIVGFGVALTFLGASVHPILAAAIIVAVIAFLAGRGIAENFAAGVILQTRRPIEIGDDVDILDHSGIVREINARSVVLETWDRRRIHIPNSTVLSNPLVNHTAYASRRSEVEVRLAIGNGLDDAVTDVVETIAAVPGVLADPPPEVIYRTVDSKRVDRGPFRP